MGTKFEEDTEEVKRQCDALQKLIGTVKGHSQSRRPDTANGCGDMKDALEETCDKIQECWSALELLMTNTLNFSRKAAGVYDESDTEQAQAMGSSQK